jgi:HAD superfamily hydrolase (TIGR01490 family)
MPIAIFDLDKTVTKKDTFIPFLLFMMFRQRRVFRPLLFCFFWGMLYILKLKTRKQSKEKFLQISLKYVPEFNDLCQEFAKIFLKKNLRNDAKKTIEKHRVLGHTLILASASPSLYVSHFGFELNIQNVIAANCETELTDHKNGIFLTEDLIGEAKLSKIKKYHRISNQQVWVYSDSKNDMPLLQYADFAFAVNPSFLFRQSLKKNRNIKVVNWN